MSNVPTGAALLKAIELPIRSTKHYVEPASDDPADVEMADFIHHNLWTFGSQSFDDVIRIGVRQPLIYGFQPTEIVYNRILSGQFAGLVGWDKLAYRSPQSRLRWNVEEVDSPGGGRIRQLISMTQFAPPTYRTIDLPRDKLLLFNNEQLGENFDGISLFRPAYEPWFYRDNLQRIEAIGLERAYMGIPDAVLPDDFTAAEFAMAQQIVTNMRTADNAGAVHPRSVELKMLFNKVDGGPMRAAIEYHDTQMLMVMLAHFIKLGTGGGGGAYSLSEDQSELFLMALNGIDNHFCETLNLWPGVPQLIGYNYNNVDPAHMPRVVHGEVGRRDLGQMGRVFMALGQWGFLTPDDATEDRLREMLELPERDATVTPEALKALVEGVMPGTDNAGRQHNAPRIGPQKATPLAKADAAQGAKDKAAMFSEMMARKPWRRADLHDPVERARVQAGESILEFMEDRQTPGGVPELPSVRMARMRNPYRLVDFAEPDPKDVIAKVEKAAKAGTIKPLPKSKQGSSNVLDRQAQVTLKHEKNFREILEAKRKRAAEQLKGGK